MALITHQVSARPSTTGHHPTHHAQQHASALQPRLRRHPEYNAAAAPRCAHPSPLAFYNFKAPNGVACLLPIFSNQHACLRVPATTMCAPAPHFLQQARVPATRRCVPAPNFFQSTRMPARACHHEVHACAPFFTAGTRACHQEVRACSQFFPINTLACACLPP